MFSHDFGKDPTLKKATGMNTVTVLQNVRVAGIIYESKDAKTGSHGPAAAVLLAMDPQDALVLKYLRDSGASQDLALRSPAATENFETAPVNGEYMLQRYQIQWRAGQ
jgi:pilus assembly protein CpaB